MSSVLQSLRESGYAVALCQSNKPIIQVALLWAIMCNTRKVVHTAWDGLGLP